jgi:hypothetical protein
MNIIIQDSNVNTVNPINSALKDAPIKISLDNKILEIHAAKYPGSKHDDTTIIPPPRYNANTVNIAALSDKLENSNTGISELQMLKIVHKLMAEMQKGESENKHALQQLKWTKLEAAAVKMEEAAGKELTSAIVSGAISMVGSALAINASKKSLSIGKESNSAGKTAHRADLNLLSRHQSSMSQVYSHGSSGAGQIASSPFTYMAQLDKADKERIDAEAAKLEARMQTSNDLVASAKEAVKAMQNLFEQRISENARVSSKIWS